MLNKERDLPMGVVAIFKRSDHAAIELEHQRRSFHNRGQRILLAEWSQRWYRRRIYERGCLLGFCFIEPFFVDGKACIAVYHNLVIVVEITIAPQVEPDAIMLVCLHKRKGGRDRKVFKVIDAGEGIDGWQALNKHFVVGGC